MTGQNEGRQCPLGFIFKGRYMCGSDRCAWWHGLMDECVVRTALVAISPALSELNSHLADLVQLQKQAVGVLLGRTPL